MQKRAFIVHGWSGSPKKDFNPWLRKELLKKEFKVFVPHMPDTDNPQIEAWVDALRRIVGEPDNDTYFIGHSIGCQTILRYLESLPDNVKVGGSVFVAGWFNLTKEVTGDPEQNKIAKPWLSIKINFSKVLKHTKKFTTVFSSNDPYVPLTDSKIFKAKLKAKIVTEKNKGHFTQDDNIKKVPVVLKELLNLSK